MDVEGDCSGVASKQNPSSEHDSVFPSGQAGSGSSQRHVTGPTNLSAVQPSQLLEESSAGSSLPHSHSATGHDSPCSSGQAGTSELPGPSNISAVQSSLLPKDPVEPGSFLPHSDLASDHDSQHSSGSAETSELPGPSNRSVIQPSQLLEDPDEPCSLLHSDSATDEASTSHHYRVQTGTPGPSQTRPSSSSSSETSAAEEAGLSGSSTGTRHIGLFCDEIGVETKHFLDKSVSLPSLNVIQNGVVVELFEYLSGNLKYTTNRVAEVVLKLVGRKDANVNSAVSRIWRLLQSHKKAKKNKRTKPDAYNSLLNEPFKIPRKREEILDTPRKKKLKKELTESKKELKTAKRKLQETSELVSTMTVNMETEVSLRKSTQLTNKHLSEEVKHLSKSVDTLAEEKLQVLKELDELTKNFNPLKHELEEYKEKYETASRSLSSIQARYETAKKKIANTSPRNTNKKLKRRDKKIEELEGAKFQVKKMEQAVKELQEELNETRSSLQATQQAATKRKEQLEKTRKDRKRMYHTMRYEKAKEEDGSPQLL